jgi:hypothetical protein
MIYLQLLNKGRLYNPAGYRSHFMRLTFALSALMISTTLVYAQGSPPDFNKMSPQDAARLNEAVRQADPQTQKNFGELEKALKDTGHPAGAMLEATKTTQP